MPQFPPLPARGQIPSWMWNIFDKIISYLKSTMVRGDGKTIRVNQTDGGFTISAIPEKKQVYTEKVVFFLEVTNINADGCPSTREWHKYTIPIISDVVEDPPTV